VLPSATLENVKVLVVDDNGVNRRVLHEQLRYWGMRVHCAESAQACLEALDYAVTDGDPFRVALLDHHMPIMDGETLGQSIKETPSLKDVLLVMLTSVGQRGEAERFKTIGFNGYLVKPVRRFQLRDMLSAILGSVSSSSPMMTRHTLAEARPTESKKRQDDKGKTLRVLVAEDNPVNQKVIARILEKLGCSVDIVSNGREALDVVSRSPFHIVMMDCQMPEMDGFGATQALRARGEGERRTPIIALTANSLHGDRERCLDAGMDDYISKPVKAEDVEMTLKRWIEQETPAHEEETEHTGGGSHLPVLDEETVLELYELANGGDFVADLLASYKTNMQEKLASLEANLRDLDHNYVEGCGTLHERRKPESRRGPRGKMVL